MAWSATDPKGKDPVAGQPGHFDYERWLKEGLIEAHATIAAQAAKIQALEVSVQDLTARVVALETP
jgi:hypothetical protein